MSRGTGLLAAAVVGFLLFATIAPEVHAQKKAVKPTMQWRGSVDDEALQKEAPTVVTNRKSLEKLWKDWKVEGKVPEIDFTKEVVVAVTSRGSKLNLSPVLDEKGNL